MTKSKPTRAEMLREKRGTRPRRTISDSNKRSRKSSRGDFPPVFVRGGAGGGISYSQDKKKKGRRRFDIALNGQGAEMRLPSIPTLGIGWRLFSVMLIALLSFVMYFLWSAPFFSVENIDITGLVHLSDEEVDNAANVIGKSIIFVDPEQLAQRLQAAFPELENISVETEIPNKVNVNLVEHQPVLAWQQEGQTYWIDENGAAYLPHSDENPGIIVQADGLIISSPAASEELLEGEEQELKIPAELVNAVLTLSKELPENSLITYDSQHGLGWFDPRGLQVYFGADGEDMSMKWKVYSKTFNRLKKAGIRPALISVEYVHAPYYRLER